MNTLQKRRRLHDRRVRSQRSRGGLRFLILLALTLGVLGSLAVVAVMGTAFAVYQSYAGDYVPITEKLRQTNVGLTEIYDRDGVHLGNLTNPDAQLLNPVHLTEISPYLIAATVSTEDNTFWENPGINYRGLTRAGWEYVTGGGDTSSGTGGSSITQQLIKNVYICPSVGGVDQPACQGAERTLDRKMREIAFALELEKDYTKPEIMEWYLNQIPYGDRYVGAGAAAEGYFHKAPADLTLAEAALLAGIPQAPTEYHPRLNCAKPAGDPDGDCVVDSDGRTVVVGAAKQRQEDVLDLMVVHRRVSKEEADAAKAEDVLVYAASNPIKASAFIDDQVEPRLVRMCEAKVLPKIEGTADCTESVHSAGWKVTTTLDSAETDVAQEMIRGFIQDGLSKGCECNNAAIVTIEPSTGQVLIYAPNRDPSYLSDRRVKGDIDQLNEINQPGSSFKPAVYLTWFDRLNKAPMSILWDTSPLPVEGTEIVNPRTGDPKSEGLITARAALGGSQNVGAFRAAQEAGPDNVIEMAKKLGITTLGQHFDPTWRSHPDVVYGASIATGGANIRAIDMAYMDSVIANMGVMVGTPNLVPKENYFDPKNLKSLALDKGADYEEAQRQALQFARGNIRLQGTRELDPVVVLQVTDRDGKVLYTEPEPVKKQVVNAGSVWLLHSIMSDCTARFVIWSCGGSNDDNNLDFFLDGVKIPGGIKTGTQQGATIDDTLETWMTGYSRYAATAVWVGNADNSLVHDGARYNYAAANTTIHLFKNWMGEYHRYARAKGVFQTPATFDSLRPPNVAEQSFLSPTTDRGRAGGCSQTVTGWRRTDVTYESECESREIDSRNGLLASDATPAAFRVSQLFVKLPAYKADVAAAFAKKMNIPIAPTEKSTGRAAVEITNIADGSTLTATTAVVGSVNPPTLKSRRLEIGEGTNPSDWKLIGQGTAPVDGGTLGTIELRDFKDGIYSIRLVTDGGSRAGATFNIRRGGGGLIPGQGTPTGGTSVPGSSVTPQLPVPNRPGTTPTPRP